MGIDWFTLLAQITNFIILMWILKKFLFERIVSMMNAREQAIADRLAEAARLQQTALAEGEQLRQQQQQLAAETDRLLAEAKQQAEQVKQQLVGQAKQHSEQVKQALLGQWQQEQTEIRHQLQSLFGKQVLSTTEQLVRQLADTDLQTHWNRHFANQLQSLDPDQTRRLIDSLPADEPHLTIASSVPLDDDQRQQWHQRLSQLIAAQTAADQPPAATPSTPNATSSANPSAALQLHFEPLPAGVIGVELRSPSQCIRWTLQEHLDQLDQQVKGTLRQRRLQHA